MKAIIYTKYGGPEVLHLKEVPKPIPGDNEVLIKVHAVSINDWDWGLVEGTTFVNRLMYGLFTPKKQIVGSDVAGRIEMVGKKVTMFKPGDEVYGDLSGRWGGFAEFVCADENALALKPASMSFVQAAAIPQAAMLAVQGLFDVGQMKPGQKLLINGAGGGVGTFAIQIARSFDVEVTAVDSADKLDMLRSMGASHVIDYRKEDFTKSIQQYDLILDVKTDRSVFKYLRVLKENGSYVTVGGTMAKILHIFAMGRWIRMFTNKSLRVVMLKPNKDLVYMNELFEKQIVKPVIDGHYQLEDIHEAFGLFGKSRHKGKLVISVGE